MFANTLWYHTDAHFPCRRLGTVGHESILERGLKGYTGRSLNLLHKRHQARLHLAYMYMGRCRTVGSQRRLGYCTNVCISSLFLAH
jgi:hypothetical protein